jgi:hypothetical protein
MIPPYQAKIFSYDIGFAYGFHTATCRERKDLSCAARNPGILAERITRIILKRVRVNGDKAMAIKVSNPEIYGDPVPLVMAAISVPYMKQRLGI